MNAPDPVVHAAAQMIPLAFIAPSTTNPRKHFDETQLAELTDSVRRHGVLQPILVRSGTASKDPRILWELVAGERRYRAAKAAGIEEIPAVVRSLTDVEALELQVVENLQRADLHPLEEAEGYEALMKRHQYTSDDIAAKVGKSRAYVYGRLKLTALCSKARDAFFAGKLDASHALLLARIPVESVQLEAMREICRDEGHAIAYRAAADVVHRRFMLRLADAAFNVKDAELIKKAGACGTCPKRTGNQPELFSDVKSADVCTDPTCFASKKTAHFAQIRVAAEAAGKKVLRGEAAKKIARWGDHSLEGHSRVDGEMWIGSDRKKVDALVKKVDVETCLIELPQSRDIVEIVNTGALQNALKKAGLLKVAPAASAARASDSRERDKRKLEVTHRQRVFDALCGRLTQMQAATPADGVLVALGVWDHSDYEARADLTARWGWFQKEGKKADWNDLDKAKLRIPELSPLDLWRLMIELVCFSDITAHGEAERLAPTAERHGVDSAAIRKELEAAAKGKTAKKKAGAKKSKKTGAPKTAKAAVA